MRIPRLHTQTPVEEPNSPASGSEFCWPDWTWTARIAGAYFAPGESEASIERRLEALVDQNVSVVLADSPWGEQFEAWVDDARFATVKSTVARMVEAAHELGLKVVLYHTGLEMLCSPDNKPGPEYMKWAQIAMDGAPILFNDVTNEQQHWLDQGVWDFWLSPCGDGTPGSDTYRALYFDRVREMVSTGIDGLWVDQVYLQGSVGAHDDLWPSCDPCSAAQFRAATGFAMPVKEDWNDPAFRRWIVWRHSQMAEFLQAEMSVARAVNPQLVFLNENSCADTGRSTYVATDPVSLLSVTGIGTATKSRPSPTAWTEAVPACRHASLDDWLAFRTMAAFARGADRDKPSWILTYGLWSARQRSTGRPGPGGRRVLLRDKRASDGGYGRHRASETALRVDT